MNAKQEIKIQKTLPTAMRNAGWIKGGTTSDRLALREIARDYEAAGKEVAFSRGAMDDVHYWYRVVLKEGQRVTVKEDHKQIKGLSVITVRPGDILRYIGVGNFGEAVCRFDDCAETPALHDAFFGMLYLSRENVVVID